jgi:hypothetical protein
MLHQTFIAIVIFYQFVLALRDHIVTGVLAKGLPPDRRFHAYCLITTLEVTAFAALAAFTEPNTFNAILKAWTVYLTWFGGSLDWIYFIAAGGIPEWNFRWYWMPKIFPYITHGRITFDHPTTKHWAAYTAIMWIPNMICWTLVLA